MWMLIYSTRLVGCCHGYVIRQVPTQVTPLFATPNYVNPNTTIQALRLFLPSRSRFCLAPVQLFEDTDRKCQHLTVAVRYIKSEVSMKPG